MDEPPTFWINQVTLASRDPVSAANFYAAVLGGEVTSDPDGRVARVTPAVRGAPYPTFCATLKTRHERGSTEWIVFEDPEGNEFCARSGPPGHERSTLTR